MDERERHIKENEGHRHERDEYREHGHDDVTSDVIADGLKAKGKNEKRSSTRRINKLWLWLGVLILVIILLWWLFTCVIAFDVDGGENASLMHIVDTMKLLC